MVLQAQDSRLGPRQGPQCGRTLLSHPSPKAPEDHRQEPQTLSLVSQAQSWRWCCLIMGSPGAILTPSALDSRLTLQHDFCAQTLLGGGGCMDTEQHPADGCRQSCHSGGCKEGPFTQMVIRLENLNFFFKATGIYSVGI